MGPGAQLGGLLLVRTLGICDTEVREGDLAGRHLRARGETGGS